MWSTKLFLLTAVLGCFAVCDSARILGVFTSPAKSHLIIHMSVVKALVERGHDVTVITTMPLTEKNKSYRHIHVPMPDSSAKQKVQMIQNKIDKPKPFWREFPEFFPKIINIANVTMNSAQVKKLMDEESFDLMILGYFFNDFQLGLAAHFKCPVIINFMIQPFTQLVDMSGTPREVSYVPNLFTGLKQPMGFKDRLWNFIYSEILEAVNYKLADWQHEKYYEAFFPRDRYPSLSDMKKNVSLILTNHHFSQGPVRPLPPAIVEIGGIHIKEKPDPLPTDIKQFLDSANETGVVYFSFGTHVASGSLNPAKAKAMFNVLSKIPFKVLWKWDDSAPFPGESSNILYKPWTPQDDILAHPNVKMFISHGGQGGVVESQYHGVPLLIVPFFGDQNANRESVENLGYGRGIRFQDITEEKFKELVNEVLGNPSYSEKIKQFSSLYRDRPMTAKQTAVYWVEYVLRHRGAPHIQSPLVHLNFFERHSLDVLAVIFGVLFVVLKISCLILCFVIRKIRGNKKMKFD
ncbi:UGT2A1.2 family protein [Megaselia abdita]